MPDKAAPRALIILHAERCKACGWCIEHCPRANLQAGTETNAKGYHPTELVDLENCTGCGQCALVCPDVCIEVYRSRRAK
jgi:2-oxoglutarate ferredoxin oxidoreductase subunit delta